MKSTMVSYALGREGGGAMTCGGGEGYSNTGVKDGLNADLM